jgi:hypothetical protein
MSDADQIAEPVHAGVFGHSNQIGVSGEKISKTRELPYPLGPPLFQLAGDDAAYYVISYAASNRKCYREQTALVDYDR